MSITFQTTAQTTIPTGAVVTCACEATVHATVATFDEAFVLSDAFNRDGGIESACCGYQTWPVELFVGEDVSVNLSNVNAFRVMDALQITPDYCGSVAAALLAERAMVLATMPIVRADVLAIEVGLSDGAYLVSVAERLRRLAVVDIEAEIVWS